jgi:hypothetical protein
VAVLNRCGGELAAARALLGAYEGVLRP